MPQAEATRGFSIGICAADSAPRLGLLLNILRHEVLPSTFTLERVIIVASGCRSEDLSIMREESKSDRRIILIDEPVRSGKADAINKIIENSLGEFLIFVNSDALPESGSISKLLNTIRTNDNDGVVSGCPTFLPSGDMTSKLLELMW